MYRNLPGSVYLLTGTKFLLMGSNFVYQFLALFLTKKAGMSEETAGLFFVASTVLCIAGSAAGGWCADCFGRRKVMFSALMINGLLYLCVPFLQNGVAGAFIAVLSIGIVAAAEPAFNALISDLTLPGQRRSAFSLIFMGSNLGFAVGPIAGGFLFNANINCLFVADGLVTIAAALSVLGTVHARSPGKIGSPAPEKYATGFLTAVRNNPLVFAFCLFFVAHSFVYSQSSFAFPLFLGHMFNGKGPVYYGALMSLNGAAVIALTPLLTKATRLISPLRCVALGIALYVAGFGLYGVIGNLWFIVLTVFIWSAGEILAITNAKVFIAGQCDPSHLGRFNTLLDISFEMGFGIGPGVAGKVMMLYGIAAVWPLMAAVAAIGSLGIFALGLRFGRAVRPASSIAGGDCS